MPIVGLEKSCMNGEELSMHRVTVARETVPYQTFLMMAEFESK